MRSAYRWAVVATIATYLLIFTGGLVRVSGAGLGCPDWPRCFGRWIPPINISQLPPEIDPSQFNFTLAWIEYLNRLFGMLVGVFILITALLAVKHFRRVRRILIPSVLAAILVAYTGWQGGQVVVSQLQSRLVSVHALFAILIAALMLHAGQQIYYQMNPGVEKTRAYSSKIRRWLTVLWIASLLQVLLGTNMRSTLEAFRAAQPLARGLAWLAQAGILNHLHMALGAAIVLTGLHLSISLLRRNQNLSSLVWQASWGLLLLAFAQGLLGIQVALAPTPLLQVLHLWSAALLVGIVLLLNSAVRQNAMSSTIKAEGAR